VVSPLLQVFDDEFKGGKLFQIVGRNLNAECFLDAGNQRNGGKRIQPIDEFKGGKRNPLFP